LKDRRWAELIRTFVAAQLEAYESAKKSAEHAYSKSKALALRRLHSRNSQAAQSAGGAPPGARPAQPGQPAPPTTPEPADRSTAAEDGELLLLALML
jgi:hypothetical protein